MNGEQPGACEALRQRLRRQRGGTKMPLARRAAVLAADMAQHPHLRRHDVEPLAHHLADALKPLLPQHEPAPLPVQDPALGPAPVGEHKELRRKRVHREPVRGIGSQRRALRLPSAKMVEPELPARAPRARNL